MAEAATYEKERIEGYWKRYVEQCEEIPDHLEGLDDQILQSWKRSRKR